MAVMDCVLGRDAAMALRAELTIAEAEVLANVYAAACCEAGYPLEVVNAGSKDGKQWTVDPDRIVPKHVSEKAARIALASIGRDHLCEAVSA